MHNVLFVHGFNSSPQSKKAQLTKAYIEQHYPQVKFQQQHLKQPFNSLKLILKHRLMKHGALSVHH